MTEHLNWGHAEQAAIEVIENWKSDEPGGVIVTFDPSGIRSSNAAGLADLSNGTAFSQTSVGRFASITKHIFCAMVLKNADKISLDASLSSYLPELSKVVGSVTVGQALDMTGGLPDMRECLSLLGLSVHTETSAKQNQEFIARQTRLNFAPGTEISYSNTGYRLVEIALERQGIYLSDFLSDEINNKLGTHFYAPHIWPQPVPHLIPGYWFDGTNWLTSNAGLQISASGSLAASAKDMAIWLSALMAGEGSLSGILDALAAPRCLNDGTVTGYGLGIVETRLGGKNLIGHGGGHPGFKSYILMDRDTKTGAIVLSNRDETDPQGAAVKVMAALHGCALPIPSKDRLKDGLYVTEKGPFWLEVNGSDVTWMDDCQTLCEDDETWVSSRSATSPLRLRQDGEALVGRIGQVERRLSPAQRQSVPSDLDGLWQSDEGALVSISDNSITFGIGPTQQIMPLTPLGAGRYLFTLKDSLWTKRVCLNLLDEDRFELALSRARMVEYNRFK